MYRVYYADGYNYNDSIKVNTKTMWFSNGCFRKAEESGKWLKVEACKK